MTESCTVLCIRHASSAANTSSIPSFFCSGILGRFRIYSERKLEFRQNSMNKWWNMNLIITSDMAGRSVDNKVRMSLQMGKNMLYFSFQTVNKALLMFTKKILQRHTYACIRNIYISQTFTTLCNFELSITLFISSWRLSSSVRRSSCESCWSFPENIEFCRAIDDCNIQKIIFNSGTKSNKVNHTHKKDISIPFTVIT